MSAPVAPESAYDAWSATYEADRNPIPLLEERAFARLAAPGRGNGRLLDAACGSGRRLDGVGPASTGLDLSAAMLAEARRRRPERGFVRGDLRRLPFRDATFDTVWCRLALGHLPEVGSPLAELARVAAPGATVIATDFHPELGRRGMRRTFFDGEAWREIESWSHSAEELAARGRAAGLLLEETIEERVVDEDLAIFRERGRPDLHPPLVGVPLVFLMRFRKS